VEIVQDVLREAGQAVIGLLTLPYFYIAVLLVWWHARHAVALQRKLYHVRLYGAWALVATRIGAGLAAGVLLSLAGMGAGAGFDGNTLMFLWIAMGVLAVFRFRYVCLAYAAGVLGVMQAIVDWTGFSPEESTLAEATRILSSIDVPALLFVAGLLHVAEGALVRLQGKKLAIPLFLQGKRGKPVGAYALSGVWPVPLLWLVPSANGGGFALPWEPLFGGGAAAWSLLAFPVLIGFSDRTKTRWPEEKARSSGNALVVYGILIAGLAVGAEYWQPLTFAAAIAAFVLHEGVLWLSRRGEAGKEPLYSQDGTGVKILAVLPGSPAMELGLQAGEIVRKVNGSPVRNKEELHAALQLQSAFCKLEVANRDGHSKFLQRAKYQGEHYQLGLVLAPDDDAEFVAAPRSASIWQGLQEAGARRLRNSPTMRQKARRELEEAAAEQAAAKAAETEALALEAAEEERIRLEGLPPRKKS